MKIPGNHAIQTSDDNVVTLAHPEKRGMRTLRPAMRSAKFLSRFLLNHALKSKCVGGLVVIDPLDSTSEGVKSIHFN